METESTELLTTYFGQPPPPLPDLFFHYTTIDGLFGIIQSKSIWASQIQYLNDSLEFNLAFDIARKNLADPSWIENPELYTFPLQSLARNLTLLSDLAICVCSFSEEGDLLSQWRAYSSRAPGFSLGFTSQTIRQSARKHHFSSPTPCVYDSSIQDRIVKGIIRDTLSAFETSLPLSRGFLPSSSESKIISELENQFIATLSICAPLLKHHSFSEEKEWRVISFIHDHTTNPNYKYRKGVSLITPYYKLELTDDHGKLNISKIIIGPTPHKDLSRNSTISFLNSNNVLGCDVQNSSTPFRNW